LIPSMTLARTTRETMEGLLTAGKDCAIWWRHETGCKTRHGPAISLQVNLTT
jgi:hypothetical protein